MEIKVYVYDSELNARIIVNDINRDIAYFLEEYRYPNNSIFGLYDDNTKELHVLRSTDEYALVYLTCYFVKTYEDDLMDLNLYAIVTSSYASLASRLIELECKILKEKTNKDKNIGLVKKI